MGAVEKAVRNSTPDVRPASCRRTSALAMRILTVHVRISLAKGKAAVARQRESASVLVMPGRAPRPFGPARASPTSRAW